MLTVALQHCGLDPSFAIGGDLAVSGSGAHEGTGDIFVAEADESDASFLAFSPEVAIVTNVEADHLDHYGTPEAYVAAFDEFLGRIIPGGTLVTCVDDPGAAALAATARTRGIRVRTYGRADGVDCQARRVPARRRRRPHRAHARRGGAPAAAARPRRAHGAQRAGRAAGGRGAGRPGRRTARRPRRVRRGAPPVRVPRARRGGGGLRRLRPPPHEGRRPAAGGQGRRRSAGGSSWRSSRTSTRARASSPASSAPRSASRTRSSCSTCTARARTPSPG